MHAHALRVVAGLSLLFAATTPCFAQLTQTRVAEGALAGKTEGAVTAYLGVPYAAPPTGDLRWKPPQTAASWQGERKAQQFAASCEQALTPNGFGPWTKEYVVDGAVAEDCLYLNVWTPARIGKERLRVLFWIYGGAFNSGSGSVPIYNGAALAAKGIVVVNVNYRVGVYGFLAHPELTAESPKHASGNYGLLDQVAALRWVKTNIAAFGGDPGRVTIAGQSAGAASVHFLIASPLAKGLFAQAIAESGSGMGLRTPDHAEAEGVGRRLSTEGGDALTLPQLRRLTATEIDKRLAGMAGSNPAAGPPALPFAPCVDGLFLPDRASVGRNTNDTPILTGMTANEFTGLNPNYGHATAAGFTAQLTETYGPLAPKFAALYPVKSDAEGQAAVDAHSRDRGLASLYFWARGRFQSTRHPIYAYLWTHVEPGPEAARYKAFHSSEVPYVFDTLDSSKRPFTAQDRAMAAQASGYWVNFVKSGNPNGQSLPTWPALTPTDPQIMELAEHARPRPVLAPNQIAAFEQFTRTGGQVSLF